MRLFNTVSESVFVKKSKIAILIILSCVFAACAALAVSGAAVGFERLVAEFINPDKNKNAVLRFFSYIGEAYGVIVITAATMLIPATRRRVGAPLSVAVIFAWLANTGLKRLIGRARPAGRLLEIGGYSFPSGHAASNAALYIGIMLLGLKLCKTRTQKAVLISVCLLMTFLIGYSRIYFNVHYLSDVVGGWCFGAIVAIVTSEIFEKKQESKNEQC